MPYIEKTIVSDEARKFFATDYWVGRYSKIQGEPEKIKQIEKVEVICSSFSDPGPDWNKYVAYDKDGNTVATVFIPGY